MCNSDDGISKLDQELLRRLHLLVAAVSEQHELKHGQTALYWHLANVLQQHIKNDNQL